MVNANNMEVEEKEDLAVVLYKRGLTMEKGWSGGLEATEVREQCSFLSVPPQPDRWQEAQAKLSIREDIFVLTQKLIILYL